MSAISFQSVSKIYPSPRAPQGGTFKALDEVQLDIEEGEFFGLLGPNGADPSHQWQGFRLGQ